MNQDLAMALGKEILMITAVIFAYLICITAFFVYLPKIKAFFKDYTKTIFCVLLLITVSCVLVELDKHKQKEIEKQDLIKEPTYETIWLSDDRIG